MGIPTLITTYTAEAVITAYRIVKFGTADGQIVQSTAATDRSIGVATELNSAIGDHASIIRSGIADVEYGGTIARGDKIVADADGKAVKAVPVAGSNVEVIGIAEVSGVLGDIASIFISPSVMQG